MAIFTKLALIATAALAVAAAPITTLRHSTAVDLNLAHSLSTDSSSLVARAESFSGRGTWFTDASGSCEVDFDTNDLIVAMNEDQMGGTSMCGKSVRISYGGKSVTARVVDTCPSQYCSHGALDLSQAAFKKLAPLDAGVIQLKWSFA
ncbi:hypothetical protein BGX29_010993 [Mortierella sp. GBA35]|nr:hypothetical protein BGX29_010993 [Mortierella sp. GBA35]